MKRFIADWIGNFVFFVPLVLLFNRGWNWPLGIVISYVLTSVVLACVGGRLYTIFLEKMWYPLWQINDTLS